MICAEDDQCLGLQYLIANTSAMDADFPPIVGPNSWRCETSGYTKRSSAGMRGIREADSSISLVDRREIACPFA
jgi:hypothetical protein